MKVFLYPFFRYEIFTITTLFPVITTVHPTSNNMFFIALSIRRFPFDGSAQIFRYFSFIDLTLNQKDQLSSLLLSRLLMNSLGSISNSFLKSFVKYLGVLKPTSMESSVILMSGR